MDNILILVLIYLMYLVIWLVINIIAYFLSVLTKKKLIDVLLGITAVVIMVLSWILGIGLLIYIVSLLFSGQFVLFLVFALIGYHVVTGLFGILQAPLLYIPSYFSDKLDAMDLNEEIETVEILDEDNNVVGVSEGNMTITRKFAKNFIILYISLLFFMILFPAEREGALIGDFVTKPFFQIISTTLIFGTIYAIYRKIKYHRFFTEDKRDFLASTWKLGYYFNFIFGFLLFIFAVLTNTYK